MPSGEEQGVATPGEGARENMQKQRDAEFGKQTPDLAKLARTSAGSAAHHDAAHVNAHGASGLDTIGRSAGTESGTGAAGNDAGGTIEVGRDAPTAATP